MASQTGIILQIHLWFHFSLYISVLYFNLSFSDELFRLHIIIGFHYQFLIIWHYILLLYLQQFLFLALVLNSTLILLLLLLMLLLLVSLIRILRMMIISLEKWCLRKNCFRFSMSILIFLQIVYTKAYVLPMLAIKLIVELLEPWKDLLLMANGHPSIKILVMLTLSSCLLAEQSDIPIIILYLLGSLSILL